MTNKQEAERLGAVARELWRNGLKEPEHHAAIRKLVALASQEQAALVRKESIDTMNRFIKKALRLALEMAKTAHVSGNADAEFKALKMHLESQEQAAPAAIDEQYGWLIENGKQPGEGLAYRFINNDNGGVPDWTPDHSKALRFARRADAEAFAHHDEDAWCIVEHAWSGASAQRQAAPAASVDEAVAIYHGGILDCGEHGAHNFELLKIIPAGTRLYANMSQPPHDGKPLPAILTREVLMQNYNQAREACRLADENIARLAQRIHEQRAEIVRLEAVRSAQSPREPLSDEQIGDRWACVSTKDDQDTFRAGFRSAENYHGITAAPKDGT